jgi:nitrate/nitrite transporter NarK
MDGFCGIAGWRWLFILEGVPACALGIYTFYLLPDGPGDVSWLSEGEKAAIGNALQREERAASTTQLSRALRDPRIAILTLSYFFLIVGVLGVTLWLPQILKQHGLSLTAIGLNSAWPYLLACIGLVVWSAHLDRTGRYLLNYVIACFVAALGFGISVMYSSLPLTLTGIAIALIGMNACRPAFFSILPTFLAGTAIAGTIAFINAMGNVGGFVGPYLVGWLKDLTGSFRPGMFALAAILAAAGVSACFVTVVRKPAEATKGA